MAWGVRYSCRMPQATTDLEERFLRHVDKTGTCWLWTGQTAGEGRRYGYYRVGTKSTDPRTTVHRIAHELWIGPIPEGMQVDHVKARGCTSTLCVNPAHLEAVTQLENNRRERLQLCRAGLHDLSDPAACRWDNQGRRRGCLRCWLDRAKDRYHQRKVGQ